MHFEFEQFYDYVLETETISEMIWKNVKKNFSN